MRWEFKEKEKASTVVTLPHDLGYDSWVPVKIGDKNYELMLHSGLGSIFLKDEKGLERSIKLRSSSISRFPGESEYNCTLEMVMAGPSLMHRFEAAVSPYVPGGAFRKKEGAEGGATMRSPMVGKVIKVFVANGDQVNKGQELCIIEAMKMENKILAPVSGLVSGTKVSDGDHVAIGDQLMKIEGPKS